eukprot:SAG22_NODE_418_length_10750_cov_11.722280_9_plen_464_part_00
MINSGFELEPPKFLLLSGGRPARGCDRDALLGPGGLYAGAWWLDSSSYFSVSKSVLHDLLVECVEWVNSPVFSAGSARARAAPAGSDAELRRVLIYACPCSPPSSPCRVPRPCPLVSSLPAPPCAALARRCLPQFQCAFAMDRLASISGHVCSPAAAAAAAADLEDPAAKVTLSPEELAFFRETGFLLLPGVIDARSCQTLFQEVLDVCEKDPNIALSHAELKDGGSREGDMLRQSAMHTKDQLLHKLRWSPNLSELASQAVDGKAMLYNGFTAVKGAKGGGMFKLHQDNQYTRHDNGDRTAARTKDFNTDGLGSCGIWIALHDLLTPESGTLLVAVGSHKQGTLQSADYTTSRTRSAEAETGWAGRDKQIEDDSPVHDGLVLPVRMRAGDICIFSRGTVHGSAPNTSENVRVGYGLQYFREDVNWLDRSTGDEFTGEWKPLKAGTSPFQKSLQPVEKLGSSE